MINDKEIPRNLSELLKEVKAYVALQKEYVRLELTEKLIILFSTLILILLALILSMVALFFFSFALVYVIAPYVGGLKASFAIIGVFCLIVVALVYWGRNKLIVAPMTRFLSNLFLNDNESK